MTVEDACQNTGSVPRVLKASVTKYRGRLQHIVPLVEKLFDPVFRKEDQVKVKTALATALGCTVQNVRNLLKHHKYDVPEHLYNEFRRKRTEGYQEKMTLEYTLALQVIAGKLKAEQAAEQLGVTKRQVWRASNKLLAPMALNNRLISAEPLENRANIATEAEKITSVEKFYT